MFEKTLSEEYLAYYQKSEYRERIDALAASLADLRYSKDVVGQHLHEWLRFGGYCERRGIDVPSCIYAREVQGYLKRRFPKGSKSRLRFIRAYLRIFIEADKHGRFAKRMRAPVRPTTTLFETWAPSYIAFLREHRGV